MTYAVEKNIPIPEHNPRGRATSAALSMEVGDSILVKTESEQKSVRATMYKYKRTVVVRKTPEGKYRIWRKS